MNPDAVELTAADSAITEARWAIANGDDQLHAHRNVAEAMRHARAAREWLDCAERLLDKARKGRP